MFFAGDDFGQSVAISGATAIVGSYFDNDNGLFSGSAYLFDTTVAQSIAELLPNDGAAWDLFGYSVALSSTTAIVGAAHNDDNGLTSGSAYLFGGTPGPVETICDDGLDNDGNGDVDCEDADCVAQPVCQEDCANSLDDDVDGDIDCEDSDCFDDPVCQEDCTNGIDDDLDDDTDCEDTNCAEHPACQEDCTNGLDDDVDGDIDCDDADCFADPACPENCSNGIDDDLDGDVDCEDADCIGQPACP